MRELVSATARAQGDDNESQNPARTSLGGGGGGALKSEQNYAQTTGKIRQRYLSGRADNTHNPATSEYDKFSLEYSQNVEAECSEQSEIKYLLGEPIDPKDFDRRPSNARIKTLAEKEQSVENKFIRIYNRQGHYSVSQSIINIYGETMCSMSRVI